MNEKRGSTYLATGLIIGLVIGIVLSIWILPVRYTDTSPSMLRPTDKNIYRIVIAGAYLVEGDTNRALSRLDLLDDDNTAQVLISQAQNLIGISGNETQARALALLAAAVNQPSVRITPLGDYMPTSYGSGTGTPSSQITATQTPYQTSTPRPTSTPQPTMGAPFALVGDPEYICDPLPDKPLLQITVLNSSDDPVAGVPIEISIANGGVETFYTGFYPEINSGYADFEMLPGMIYAIQVGEAGQLISNLSAPLCDSSGSDNSYGSLNLTYRQP